MKLIGFIGAFDKTDLLLNIAKILTLANKKVLLIDSTLIQKSRYIVPVINPTKSYVTTFEDMDIAVGFESLEDVKKYMALNTDESFEYDIVLVDADRTEIFDNFDLIDGILNYFVTSFDLCYLRKGLEVLRNIKIPVEMKKVLYIKESRAEENNYLNFLSQNTLIKWNKEKVYFPFDQGDQSAHIENQRVEKIKIKDLSEDFKEGILIIASEIADDISDSELRRIMKNMERG